MSPRLHTLYTLILLPALALTTGCEPTAKAPESDTGVRGFAKIAESAVAEVREELATENMKIGRGRGNGPRAEISPAGELFIGGEKVALDARQQALMLEYRQQLVGVAEAGADIGLQAAALAGTALTEVARSAFSADVKGMEARIEARVEAEAETLKASATQLCGRLPALLDSQRRTAEAVPEFVPYANMTQEDVDDCEVTP